MNTLILKWAEDLSNFFSKNTYRLPTGTCKKCSTSLIRGMKIKTTMRYDFTPIRMATIFNKMKKEKQKVANIGKYLEKLAIL